MNDPIRLDIADVCECVLPCKTHRRILTPIAVRRWGIPFRLHTTKCDPQKCSLSPQHKRKTTRTLRYLVKYLHLGWHRHGNILFPNIGVLKNLPPRSPLFVCGMCCCCPLVIHFSLMNVTEKSLSTANERSQCVVLERVDSTQTPDSRCRPPFFCSLSRPNVLQDLQHSCNTDAGTGRARTG